MIRGQGGRSAAPLASAATPFSVRLICGQSMAGSFRAATTGPPSSPDDLRAWIRSGGRTAVALSGGVDSAVVALLARESLGDLATAVTLVGPAVAADEVERARGVARHIGIEHRLVEVDQLAVEEYRSNPSGRCYFCRRTETGAIRQWGDPAGVRQYLDGVHTDDLGDDRPGLRAMDEAGFHHPLLEAGWKKVEVREFARKSGLPNWDAPSDACLASRISHGEPITLGGLARVERSEEYVRSLGFRRVRVRVAGNIARVEVDPSEVSRLSTNPVAGEVAQTLRGLGFLNVVIDPHGYRARPGA